MLELIVDEDIVVGKGAGILNTIPCLMKDVEKKDTDNERKYISGVT